jgi:solute carrier family 13 (sodium-dependent dicarboxylate transporter), member 2/3/5
MFVVGTTTTNLDHEQPYRISSNLGLLLGVAVLVAILMLPRSAALPVPGQRMLAVFAFAAVIWVTEALDYAVSAIVIAGLMALLLGTSPDPTTPQALLGTVQGLTIAMSGFANAALTLVAAALFLTAAMTVTGLDR